MADDQREPWIALQSAEDEESIIIEDDAVEGENDEESRCWLVGKLLTAKPFKGDDLMATTKLIWKTSREIEFVSLEKNLFLFKCENIKEKKNHGRIPMDFQ